MAVKLLWEPVEITAGEVDDAVERSTWGLFRLTVSDGDTVRNLTRVEQVEGKTLADGVYGPMVPIAEWLARNWWHLVRSRRALLPDAPRTEAYAWNRVRTLSYVGDGLPLPVVTFQPEDADRTRVYCEAEPVPSEFARVRFVESCSASIDTAALREAIRGFVESILERLRATCPHAQRLHDLEATWAVATDPNSAQHERYVRACQAGERWGAVAPTVEAILSTLPPRGRQPLLDAVIERIPVGGLADWHAWAEERWDAAAHRPKIAPQSQLARLRAQVAAVPTTTPARPWLRGWDDARRLRQSLGVSSRARPRLPRVRGTVDARLGPRESVIAWRTGRTPLRVFGADSTNFLGIRDLHAPLFGADADTARLHSPRVAGSASVANAFAAEWLAPVEQVRAEIGDRAYVGLDDVMEIAAALKAPAACVRHQIQNHRLASVDPAA